MQTRSRTRSQARKEDEEQQQQQQQQPPSSTRPQAKSKSQKQPPTPKPIPNHDDSTVQQLISDAGVAGLGIKSREAIPEEFMTDDELKLRYWDHISRKLQVNRRNYPHLLLTVSRQYPSQLHMVLPTECRIWFRGNNHEEKLASIILAMIVDVDDDDDDEDVSDNNNIDRPQPQIRIDSQDGKKPIIIPKNHHLLAKEEEDEDDDDDSGPFTPIFIQLNHKMFTIHANLQRDVTALNAMITRTQAIPQQDQSIRFDDKVLEQGKSLDSYGIQKKSLLTLKRISDGDDDDGHYRPKPKTTNPSNTKTRPPIATIYARAMGQVFELKIGWDQPIEHLKQLYQDQNGIPPEQQNLVLPGGRHPVGYETVDELGLEDGDIVHIIGKLRGC